MLREAKDDLTAFADFPHAHWAKIWSTNSIEHVNQELKRRTDVVGILPNTDRLLRLSASCSSKPTTNGSTPTGATHIRRVHVPAVPHPTDRPPNPQRGGDRRTRTRYGIVDLLTEPHAHESHRRGARSCGSSGAPDVRRGVPGQGGRGV